MKSGKSKKRPVREPEIFQALLKRFPVPEYALFPQVPDGTGAEKSRTADAVAISLWPSRGIYISGFEFKSWRGDWLAELRTPAKADRVARYCDFWWVVAADDSVVQVGKVPPPWGLLVLKKKGLRLIKGAEELKAEPLNPFFMAGLLRRAQRVLVDTDALLVAERRGHEKGTKEEQERIAHQGNSLMRQNLELKQTIEIFEKKSGVKINTWNVEQMGEAVRRIVEGDDALRTLEWAKRDVEHALKEINQALSRNGQKGAEGHPNNG